MVAVTSASASGDWMSRSAGNLGSAGTGGSQVVAPVAASRVMAASGSVGETQVSWPWGACGNPAAPAMLSAHSGQAVSGSTGSGDLRTQVALSPPVSGGPAVLKASPKVVASPSLGFSALVSQATPPFSGATSQVTEVSSTGVGQPVSPP